MAYFPWDPALETGHEMLDAEHKSLFALANALETAIDDDSDDDEAVANAVYGLADYVVEHFTDEQALMREYQYPPMGQHRALHEQLTTEVLLITARFMNENNVTPSDLAPLICTWLTDHIKVHDIALVEFVERADASHRSVAAV